MIGKRGERAVRALLVVCAWAEAACTPGADNGTVEVASLQQSLEGQNIAANGSFDREIAPTAASKMSPDGTIIAAPEMLAYETTDTPDGHGGALRVIIDKNPDNRYRTHNSGVSVQLTTRTPSGTWLRVGFSAKSLSGGQLVEVVRTNGGSTPGYVRIGPSWEHYETYIRPHQDMVAVLFSLRASPPSPESISDLENGVFLLDDVTISTVSDGEVSTTQPTAPDSALLERAYAGYESSPDKPGSLGPASGGATPTEDGRGLAALYQQGGIYATSGTGAHVVYGPVHEAWRAAGAGAGKLGYPLTDTARASDGQGYASNFENGLIYWSPATGAIPMLWAR